MILLGKPYPLLGKKRLHTLSLTWPMIGAAVNRMVRPLKEQSFDSILALVRGGVVPAILLSHRLNIRMIHFFQGCRTGSNQPHDYRPLSILSTPKVKKNEKLLVVEDIIFHGETISKAIQIIEKQQRKVTAIASLVGDRDFFQSEIMKDHPTIFLIVAYVCDHRAWIRFPWEQRIRGEDQCQ